MVVSVPAIAPAADRQDVAAAIEVEDLVVEVRGRRGPVAAVDGVSFRLERGEILGLVGESGCGKTMTALALMRLLPDVASIASGRVLLGGRDVVSIGSREMRRVRGGEMSMVFQEPMASLDPAFTVGAQIIETIRAHERVSKAEARDRAVSLLERVGIPNPAARVGDFPHQFSGGMRQRVMLAIALALGPRVLIADEPTTALDVTIQAQILELIASLREELGMSVVLITHSLAVVHEVADRVAVMYAGEIVETAGVQDLFAAPRHPYTRGLLRSMPGPGTRGRRLEVIPGRVPDLGAKPPGCRFAPRCPNVIDHCTAEHPDLQSAGAGRGLRCYNPVAGHER
jgi:oligopeptide/dipeptide ABC transporter ATP-binding protein